MLVLSRRVGESVVIDGKIRVKVCEITDRGKIRLGIEAPREVQVDREEVHNERKRLEAMYVDVGVEG